MGFWDFLRFQRQACLHANVWRFCLVLLASLGALGSFGHAQRLMSLSSGQVTFRPLSAELEKALSCPACLSIMPTENSFKQSLRIQRQAAKSYSLAVRYLTQAEGLLLEARFTIDPKGNNPRVQTDWLELSGLSQDLLSSSEAVTDIAIEYRLRLTGQELAGRQTATVLYTVANASVEHQIDVLLPAVAVVKVESKQSGANPSLNFNYQGLNTLDYLRAVQTGQALAATESGLGKVAFYTNHPKGASVTLELFEVKAPEALADKLFLSEQPLARYRFRLDRPSFGFETLALPADFALRLTGLEQPGRYQYVLRYKTELNP